jgi:hypothetical protein
MPLFGVIWDFSLLKKCEYNWRLCPHAGYTSGGMPCGITFKEVKRRTRSEDEEQERLF